MRHAQKVTRKAVFNPSVQDRRDPRLLQRKRDGFWYVRFHHDGETKDKMLGVATEVLDSDWNPPTNVRSRYVRDKDRWVPKDVHDKFVAEFKTPYIRGLYNPWEEESNLLLGEAVDAFLAQHTQQKHTLRSYSSVLKRFREHLPNPHQRLARVSEEEIQSFLDAPDLRPASRESYYRQLRAFFNWAAGENHIKADSNPFNHIRKPVNPGAGTFAFCTPDVYESVIAELRKAYEERRKYMDNQRELIWVESVWDLAVSTGLRRAELQSLQWQDVDRKLGTIVVRAKTSAKDGIDFMPKGRRDRRVEINPRAAATLDRLGEAYPDPKPKDFVLPSPQARHDGSSRPMNAEKASKLWREFREKAGLPEAMDFHGLRHLFVTYMLLLGFDQFVVQALAGHTDYKVTQGYAHFAESLVSSKARADFRERLVKFGFALPGEGRR